MRFTDPYPREKSRYECTDCLERVTVDGHRAECPECGGRVRNVAVARE